MGASGATDGATVPAEFIVGGIDVVGAGAVSAGSVPCGRRLSIPASPLCGVPARCGNDRLISPPWGPSFKARLANLHLDLLHLLHEEVLDATTRRG